MYNTNNPVEPNGSSDPRDLGDNAQVLDLLLNSSQIEVVGRKGKKLKGIAALQEIITSLDLGSFTFPDTTAGLAGTSSGQYFRVPQSSGSTAFIYYVNNNGAANEVARVMSANSFRDVLNDGFYFTDSEGFNFAAIKMGERGPTLSGLSELGLKDVRLVTKQGSLLSFIDTEGFEVDFTVLLSQMAEMDSLNPHKVSFRNPDKDDFQIKDNEGFVLSLEKLNKVSDEKVQAANDAIASLKEGGSTSAIVAMQMESAAQAAMQDNFTPYDPPVARLKKGLNIVIIFGQSLSVGAQSYTRCNSLCKHPRQFDARQVTERTA